MRGLGLFGAGIVVGLAVHVAIAQNEDGGLIGVNHVGVAVDDMDTAIEFYTETLGFPEAFRITNDAGELALVYVQVSASTFVELQPVNDERPAGFSHFGVHVEDMDTAIEMWRSRGIEVQDRVNSSTNAVLSNIRDPWGNRMELLELPPNSRHAQATTAWR